MAASIYHFPLFIMVNTARALFDCRKYQVNIISGLFKDFVELLLATVSLNWIKAWKNGNFKLNQNGPTEAFAKAYLRMLLNF